MNTLKVAGVDALAKLHALRAEFPRTGLYPFLIGDQNSKDTFDEMMEANEDEPDDIIQESFGFDLGNWIKQRPDELFGDDFNRDDLIEDWPSTKTDSGSICMHNDIVTGKTHDTVYIGTIPLEQPWQLPAVLRYGGWNDCPLAHVHCALFRHWQEKYGAEIVSMGGDVVEAIVSKSPATREQALELAWEQYWYCYDIVDQGIGSVTKLAASLMGSKYWYFWWD